MMGAKHDKQWKRVIGNLPLREPSIKLPIGKCPRGSVHSAAIEVGVKVMMRTVGNEIWIWRYE